MEELDEHSRWLYYAHGTHLNTVTDEHVRTARHAYYGMCTYIDDKVGRIMEAMRATGLADDTIVIFISDHGEMLGERGMWYKQTFFEWSTRSAHDREPARHLRPGRVSDLVSLGGPLADAARPGHRRQCPAREPSIPLDGNQSHDLLSGGDGRTGPTRWSRSTPAKAFARLAACFAAAGTSTCTRTGFPGMLFDVEADPLELENLVERPDHAGDRTTSCTTPMLDGWDPEDVNQRCLESQRRRRFVQRATGGEPYWAYKVRPDDDTRFVRNAGCGADQGQGAVPVRRAGSVRAVSRADLRTSSHVV